MVQLQPVDSPSIELIAYEPETRRLYVRYRASRDAYVYHDVSPLAYTALMTSDAKGRYLNRTIKSRCTYTRLSHKD